MQMHTMDLLLQPSHLLRDDLTLRQRQILYRGLMKNYCGNIYLKTTPRLFLKMIYHYFLRFHTINLINFKICLPDFFFLNIEFFFDGFVMHRLRPKVKLFPNYSYLESKLLPQEILRTTTYTLEIA